MKRRESCPTCGGSRWGRARVTSRRNGRPRVRQDPGEPGGFHRRVRPRYARQFRTIEGKIPTLDRAQGWKSSLTALRVKYEFFCSDPFHGGYSSSWRTPEPEIEKPVIIGLNSRDSKGKAKREKAKALRHKSRQSRDKR